MFSEMKTIEREEARRLRRDEGRSMKEIAKILGVSKSSVSLWVRDIELTAAQHAALQEKNGLHERQVLARAAMAAKARARRLAWQQEGRRRALAADGRYVAGCMLYWAEGSRNRNRIVFTNSDPQLVRYFLEFLRAAFDPPVPRIRVSCNPFRRPCSTATRDRRFLAANHGAAARLSLQIDRQPAFALQQKEAHQ
jgi:transposase-like protein